MAIKFGTSQDDLLNGTENNDLLFGFAGNDTLVGGGGRDRLFGGQGNDTYVIDQFDRLFEFRSGGTDTVIADFTYTLPKNFENLILAGTGDINGTGNAADNVIVGNPGSNVLTGGDGNDTLDGGLGLDVFGIDVLFGGAGNDALLYDTDDLNAPDATGVRYDGGPGTDALVFGDTDAALNLAATSFDAIKDVEVLDLSGAGNHSVLFTEGYVLSMSSTTNVVQVEGGAGDRVGTADPDWTFTGNVTIGEQTYAEYVRGEATLRVDVDIDRLGIAALPTNDTLSVDGSSAPAVTALANDNVTGTDGSVRTLGLGDVLDLSSTANPTAGGTSADAATPPAALNTYQSSTQSAATLLFDGHTATSIL